jgi:hypothetical protein
MTERTSTMANIAAIRADYSDAKDVNEIIDLVEASQADPYGSTLALLYGTAELHKEENIIRARAAANHS